MRTLTHPDLKLSEREVTAQIVGTDEHPGFVRMEGWEPIRIHSGTVRGVTRGTYISLRPKKQRGIADWICVRGVDYFFLETKAPGKELSNDQLDWHGLAKHMGFPVIVADGLGCFIEAYRKRWPK